MLTFAYPSCLSGESILNNISNTDIKNIVHDFMRERKWTVL